MMKKVWFIGLWICISASTFLRAQEPAPAWAVETPAEKQERMAWWTHDRFGMFIHWGIYAMPARHEWIKLNEKISDVDYQKYFENFDPDLYNPREWAAKARAAGMKYVVVTTKHHDGFCLWDSQVTDYKVTNTPYGKDLIAPLVEAFRAEGIRIGFYYSLLDWHHPDFPLDRLHPAWPGSPEAAQPLNANRSMERYRTYMKAQLTELLTRFGRIDELFMDFSYPGENGKGHRDWKSEELLKLIRSLQPHIVVDNRMDMEHTDWGWDFVTPEQFMPQEWPTLRDQQVPWETCQTFSGSWGYYRDEYSWKSIRQLVVMLIETVSKGGNLLLNVGPTARGTFDHRALDRLDGLARWMHYHSRSIYGCSQAPKDFAIPQNCFLTYNAEKKRLYIHLLEWPFKSLHLPGYKGRFRYAQLLNDASEVQYTTPTTSGSHTTENSAANDVVLSLPVQRPDVEIPVIELFLE
ncbi:MAG: alpha-L-fucosidase [Tannerellaceae bacterium]|jgi:alpha-L-fucosidase|nr:alpha-L-fucosidase [Tannerellaceae bacterium]